MYEKKISIFNNIDRRIYNVAFKYNVIFLGILLLIIFSIVLLKKNYYYQNTIIFKDGNQADLVVDRNYLNNINNNDILILNNVDFKYNIDRVEEIETNYIVSIHFNNEIKINTNTYKVLLGEESLLKYIVRMMRGE